MAPSEPGSDNAADLLAAFEKARRPTTPRRRRYRVVSPFVDDPLGDDADVERPTSETSDP